jgi:hypothetical protein
LYLQSLDIISSAFTIWPQQKAGSWRACRIRWMCVHVEGGTIGCKIGWTIAIDLRAVVTKAFFRIKIIIGACFAETDYLLWVYAGRKGSVGMVITIAIWSIMENMSELICMLISQVLNRERLDHVR